MPNKNKKLGEAKVNKKDEFYTQYTDIQNEVNAYIEHNPDVFRGKTILLPCDDPEWSNFTKFFALNFENFGLKKLISTSYAADSRKIKEWQPTLFESNAPQFDKSKTHTNGKIFVLDSDANGNGRIDIEDLKWDYLKGDGDFRSDEVKKLRDEADIIVTNPPFSLFGDFFSWVVEAGKKFLIIGHQNAITYKEVFPLIKENKAWLGNGFKGGAGHFISDYNDVAVAGNHLKGMIRVSGVVWFTNLEHGQRHKPLKLMTKEDNLRYNKKLVGDMKKKYGTVGYFSYDNYKALDVLRVDGIPSDYDGVIGVPVTFLEKYCPEQFEIIGNADDVEWLRSIGTEPIGQDKINKLRKQGNKAHVTANMTSLCMTVNGLVILPYKRIIVRKRG